jgi:RNA polymerase sigma factor for flagellar operon FliA
MADLAARVGSDEKRLSRTIVRINTIEATSPLATGEHLDESSLPTALVPSEPEAPDAAYERTETRERVRGAIQALPWRERKVIALYYYGEVTMKQIGAEIGVNESRVSQLHARAIRRLRDSLGDMNADSVAEMKRELIDFATKKPELVKVAPARRTAVVVPAPAAAAAVVLPYKQPAPAPRQRAAAAAKAPLRVARQQRAVAVAR